MYITQILDQNIQLFVGVILLIGHRSEWMPINGWQCHRTPLPQSIKPNLAGHGLLCVSFLVVSVANCLAAKIMKNQARN